MFFGLAAVVDGAPEPATVTTLSAMRLRVATWHAFGELCEVEPVARALRQILAVLLRDAYRSGTMQRVAPRVEIREAG
jgi:CRP-like cAMP-binding protein